MNKEIHIFTGHFGSGKTELALNFALKRRNIGQSVTVIDIDIVNPYFRASDAAEPLAERGIRLIAGEFASSNVDMPIIPPQIYGVFEDESEVVIFDAGGGDGARVLGVYYEALLKTGYNMHYVINTKRPLTSDADSLEEAAREIESVSRLKLTDIYHNTNLAEYTDGETLKSGIETARELAARLGIPIAYHCGRRDVLAELDGDMPKFEIEVMTGAEKIYS